MAGSLTISTLNNDTGVLATQNGMTGIAKAWVNYNGQTQTINGSFNVSSVTYTSTGRYAINFSTAMSNANYSTIVTGYEGAANGVFGFISTDSYTTSVVSVQIVQASNGSPYNPVKACVAILGS